MSQHEGNRRVDSTNYSTNSRQSTSKAASLATKLSTVLQNKKAQNLDKKCTAVEGRIQNLQSKINKKKLCEEKLAEIVNAAALPCCISNQSVLRISGSNESIVAMDHEEHNNEYHLAITTIKNGLEAVIKDIDESGYKNEKIVQQVKGSGGPKGSGLLRLYDCALDMVKEKDSGGLFQIEETFKVARDALNALVQLHAAEMDKLKKLKDRVAIVRQEVDEAKLESPSRTEKIDAADKELAQIQKELDNMNKAENKKKYKEQLRNAFTDTFKYWDKHCNKKPPRYQT